MSMQNIKKTLSLLCVGALTLTVITGCNRGREDESADAVAEQIMLPVQAAVAKNSTVTRALNFSGNIDAFRRAALAPALQGARIQRIFVDEGQQVREGQLVARMEDFQLRQSAANLAQLEADLQRMQELQRRGSATQQQLEQITTAFNAARAGHDLLVNSVELRAPFSGTVIGRHANEGELFTGAPGADGVSGIISVAQLGRMKIEVMVPEQDFVLLRPGMTAQIRTDAYPDTVFEGTIFTVNAALNRISRTSRVVIELNNPHQLLKPGMFARAEIVIARLDNVLAVPTTAIVTRDGMPHVFTVERLGDVPFPTNPTLVPVKLGMETNALTEIVEGLSEGAIVLTDNNVSLVPTTMVRVTRIVE